MRRGIDWLCSAQNQDGSWGGGREQVDASGRPAAGSIEETALAVEALLSFEDHPAAALAGWRGAAWLIERVEDGRFVQASPIGFYFAKLWYYERLYPVLFTVAALARASSSRAG